jgi:DNA polymerase-3 subunit alpha
MAATLETTAGKPVEPKYIREARHVGVRLLAPDVNISGPVWTLDRNKQAVRKGLSSIKGVGHGAALAIHENAPYKTLEELIEACPARLVTGGKSFLKDGTFNGVLLKLRDAGALSSLGYGRVWE